jgi:MarR family transcriptional regulator, lower aerobic nicotinate degradation pathway regulator
MIADIYSERSRSEEPQTEMMRVVDSIRVLVKALRDSGRDAEQKLGITSAQLYVLQALRDQPASINELAARTYTHQSSVSMVVARLVDSRLVRRSAVRGDARKLSVSLTPAGRNLVKKAPDVAQTRVVNALRAMSKSDLKALSSQLTNLTEIMDSQERASRRRLGKARLAYTA